MVSIKVRVLNKDNRFGGRNVDISFGSSSFKTPHRAATHKDYHAASSLPHNVTIGNPVSEYVSAFDNTSFDAFLSGNGSFAKRKERIINQSIDMMRYSPIMSTIKIPSQERLTQDHLMLFNEFQNHEQLDIISIPPFKYKNIKEYEEVIVQFSEAAMSRRQEAMPILPLSTELKTFKNEFESLRRLHNTGICNVIGFAYANPDKNPHQLLEIYKHREEDIWYHAFGIPRTQRGRKVANIHRLQNWGLDTFSPEVRYIGKKQVIFLIMKSKTTKPDEVQCQRFDSPTLGIFKEPEWIGRYGHDLHCDCPVCKGKDLTSFKQEFTHELNGDFNSNLLRNADKVHELVSGSKEFDESMKAIKSDDLPAYYESKEFTKGRVKPPG
ncbi:MAG: hypothetical protein SCH70_04830 [Candidatus Methanoperedens sp.]|nr:hypothetical protein [Candidatus Methanoperedens sp.]